MSKMLAIAVGLLVVVSAGAAPKGSPEDVAQRVADRIVANARLDSLPLLASESQQGEYLIDFGDGAGCSPSAAYFASAVLEVAVPAAIDVLDHLRLSIRHDAGGVIVKVAERALYEVRDDTSGSAEPSARGSMVLERTVPVRGFASGQHPMLVEFRPTTSAGRLVLRFFDERSGTTVSDVRVRAPGFETDPAAPFVLLGPVPRDALPPPFSPTETFNGINGQRVQWRVSAPQRAATVPGPSEAAGALDSGVLDALYAVSDTFETLDYRAYIERHLGRIIGGREPASAGGATGRIPADATPRRNFTDEVPEDAGLRTLPFLERLRRARDGQQLTAEDLQSTPEGRLVADALDHIGARMPRLDDGTIGRSRPEPLTVWADDGFAVASLLMRAAYYLDGPSAIEQGDSVLANDAVHQLLKLRHYLFDESTGVYFHGYSAPRGQTAGARWSRTNGSLLVAKAELLGRLPSGHPRHADLLGAFRHHARALKRWQALDGRWHQVVNRPDTVLETSGTALIVAALATGVEQEWLDGAEFIDSIRRGWRALARQIDNGGAVGGMVGAAVPVLASAAADPREQAPADDPHGLGAVLHAASAVERLRRTGTSLDHVGFNPLEGDPAFAAYSLFIPEFPPPDGQDDVLVVLHGFGSAVPNGTYKRIERALRKTHWVLGFNYDPADPARTVQFWQELVSHQLAGKRVSILGTSLGGWWAWQLGERASVQNIIMMNPVMKPDELLGRYLGKRKRVDRRNVYQEVGPELVDLYMRIGEPSRGPARLLVLLCRDDDRLDYRVAEARFEGQPRARLTVFDDGGHTMDLKKHPALPVIVDFVRAREGV